MGNIKMRSIENDLYLFSEPENSIYIKLAVWFAI